MSVHLSVYRGTRRIAAYDVSFDNTGDLTRWLEEILGAHEEFEPGWRAVMTVNP